MSVIYEDSILAVCVKPCGVESEKEFPALMSEKTGGKLFPVHRLDKEAGGIIVYAKTQRCAAELSAGFASGSVNKKYRVTVEGAPEQSAGTYTDLLFHDRNSNKTYAVTRERRGVKRAELEYSVIGSAGGFSLCEILLHTGRTHQIRVQFASRKMPVAGDRRYGSHRDCHLALWSFGIGFTHPETGERMEFECPPPDEYPWVLFDK